MGYNEFPVIDLKATGRNIRRLRIERGLSVSTMQTFFGFVEPRAIYKWQNGETLPTVDNLFALGKLLKVPMDQILIPLKNNKNEQQDNTCCSNHILNLLYLIMFFHINCNQICFFQFRRLDSPQFRFPNENRFPLLSVSSHQSTNRFAN